MTVHHSASLGSDAPTGCSNVSVPPYSSNGEINKENSITSIEAGLNASDSQSIGSDEGPAVVPHMGLISSCNMIVGLIIGSGIFATPGPVTLKVQAVGPSLIVWTIGGLLSMIGALCYAELGTMITKSGGEYQYLKSAYGLCLGLTFSWSNLLLSNPIGTASIATVFAQYIMEMAYFDPSNTEGISTDMPDYAVKLVAIACIWVVVLFNAFGRKAGAMVANVFTAAKLLALAMIIIIGWIWLGRGHTENFKNAFHNSSTNALDYGTAMYMALFAYNGWNNLNYGVAEVKNPQRNLPLAITISCILVTLVYVLGNIAYFATLPISTVANSSTVAMQVGMVAWGKGGAYFFALMVVLSTFGAVNGNIWAASRVVLTAANEDGVYMPSFFGKLNEKRQSPIWALILVGIIATIWCIPGNFTYLAKMYSFIYWLFYGIAVFGLIIMRFKKSTKNLHRPFKIWLPFAIFFCIIDIYLVIAPLVDAGSAGVYQYIICIVIGLLAIPIWFVRVKKPHIGRMLFGWIPNYQEAYIVQDKRRRNLRKARLEAAAAVGAAIPESTLVGNDNSKA
ncbi:amino acid permease-domain-containing protein [Cokeromyces recurvatus]|uniref:amino acid permease-domain-containing protein n=1 Tax=Cokeromyces recurvatus TaxID=90255 RepID=UPI0022205F20|nr:amino acid permease-domain-containing protein [Cokeromyces recurvatus]KAI7901722.1 amino acid permease-domain-containing protein [Cokeromyces recurvatus]